MSKQTISLCFEVEADEVDIHFLKKALRKRPGAPVWLRHYLERALEQVAKDAWDGGVWRFEVTGGEVNGA
jgi:hypothetical protein